MKNFLYFVSSVALLIVGFAGSAVWADTTITGISVVGPAVKIFDHTQKVETLNITDGPLHAWKEADGTVNLMMNSPEMYRLRGPDLRHLTFNPTKIYSSFASGDQDEEDLYNTWHWFSGPYSLDGQNFYSLTHSEWYPDLLNGQTIGPNGEGFTGLGFTVTTNLFSSSDGGASWGLRSVNGNHVVAKEAYHWTGSVAAASQAYLNAPDNDSNTGMDALTGLIKEGNYYYSMGTYRHRDFTQLNPAAGQYEAPVDAEGLVLMRTNDITNPNNWQAWSGGSTWDLISNHNYKVFKPLLGGVSVTPWAGSLTYDTNAQVFICIIQAVGSISSITQNTPVGYITTKTLANPSFSDYTPIGGVPAADPTAFWPYTVMIDPDSTGFNFEYTSGGQPLLFWSDDGPLVNGHHLPANRSDIYYAQLAITYSVAPTAFDFSLSNSGDQSVMQGSSIQNTITATLVSGTAQVVTFSISGLPAGVSPSFGPTNCSPACSTTLTLNTDASTLVGTYPLTVSAQGGSVTRTSSFNLNITALPSSGNTSFSLTPTALPISVVVGSRPDPQPLTLTNTGPSPLNWTVTASGNWLAMYPAADSLPSGQSETLSAFVYSATLAAGTYNATITVGGNADESPQIVNVTLQVGNSGGTSVTLPDLDLSRMPNYAVLSNHLNVTYDPSLNVSFIWTFTPTQGQGSYTSGQAGAPAASGAGSINFKSTSAQTPSLVSQGLTLGTYQVTVQAQDNTNPANLSNPKSKAITLVGSDFSQLRVYPNPWRTDKHGSIPITFDHLPIGSTIKIFTISGHWVKTLTPAVDSITWDRTNNNGDNVASGDYVYLITVGDSNGYGGSGQKTRGQLVIIK